MTTAKRLAAAALCLIATVVLAGCNVAQVNPERDREQVIARVNNVEIKKGLIVDFTNAVKANYITAKEGDPDYKSQFTGLEMNITDGLIQTEVIKQYCSEYGVTGLSDEEAQAVEEQFQNEFEQAEQVAIQQLKDGGNENPSQEDIQKTVDSGLAAMGYTRETYKAYLEDQKFVEKAKNAIKATVTEVSDSEIQDFYDRTLESQGNTFGQYPEQYEQAMIYGDYITYNVEGYRRIKQILIGYTDEDKGKLDEQIGNEEGYQAALQTAQENIRAEAEDVLSQVKSGADFDGLITTYNDDPGISSFPDGYYVSADSAIWDPVFITAAMALAKVGDTSELVATNYGYHILKYASDVTPGAIPLNQIDKEKSREAALADKKEEFLKAEVERWESIAKIERFYDRL